MHIRFTIQALGISDKGLVREKNEDYHVVDSDRGLFIVADGIGGHAGGEIASKLTVETISDFFKERSVNGSSEKDIFGQIDGAVQKAHNVLITYSNDNNSLKGMGATVVIALWQSRGSFVIANMGDSRAYLFRDQTLRLITQDHSVTAQLVEQGDITSQEARGHRLRNIVTQAIGTDISIGCYHKTFSVQEGDKVLLCSDGLWDMVPDEVMEEFLTYETDLQAICLGLVEKAKSAGGKDNITIVAISVNGEKQSLYNNALAQAEGH
ncbi:MAG: Stp1/IreP family PP2C-type Ser/Thr phosphatase [Desulfobacteraceae bacterium]|nr:Stp1/IreP family PP2C-type Ser/Thr phosphatase [Desulfobacteraceae bacterium]